MTHTQLRIHPRGSWLFAATILSVLALGVPSVTSGAAKAFAASADTTTTSMKDEGGKGNPRVITFTIQWRTTDGTVVSPLAASLPAGWEGLFTLTGGSATGKGNPTSASCSYPTGSDVLTCTFTNPGHGNISTGMVVRAKATATYTVAVSGVPEGWEVDATTVGTFSAGSACTQGNDAGGPPAAEASGGESGGCGDEGDEGDEGGGAGGAGDTGSGHKGGGCGKGGGQVTCTHTVIIDQMWAATSTTAVEAEAVALPQTGSTDPYELAILALAFVGAGIGLLRIRFVR